MRGYLSTRSRVQVLTGLTAFALLVYSVSVYNLAGSQLALQGGSSELELSSLRLFSWPTKTLQLQLHLRSHWQQPIQRFGAFSSLLVSSLALACMHLVPQFNYPSP